MCEDQVALANLIVLSLTLVVVSIYTYLTHRLHKASTQQTNELVSQRLLSVLPSLVHEIEYDSRRGGEVLSVRNIGNGTAANVQLDKVTHPTDPHSFYVARHIGTVRPGQAVEVKGKMFIQDKEFDESFLLVICPIGESDANYRLTFRFQDIEGRTYVQTNVVADGIYSHGGVQRAT